MRFRVLPIQPITITIAMTITVTVTINICIHIFMLSYAILASIFHVNFNFLTNLLPKLPKLLKRITNFILILFATQIVCNIYIISIICITIC